MFLLLQQYSTFNSYFLLFFLIQLPSFPVPTYLNNVVIIIHVFAFVRLYLGGFLYLLLNNNEFLLNLYYWFFLRVDYSNLYYISASSAVSFAAVFWSEGYGGSSLDGKWLLPFNRHP